MTAVADDVVARGERVLIRKKRLSDAAVDYAWRRDPELASFDAARPLRSSFREFLMGYSEDIQYPAPYRRTFAIEDLEGHHIGNVMVYNIDERQTEGELGITIGDRNYWNSGWGTDAVATFVGYLFSELGLQRVILHTLDWNLRAQRAFIKAGFSPVGHVKRGEHNFMFMEVRRAWWEASRRSPGGSAPADTLAPS